MSLGTREPQDVQNLDSKTVFAVYSLGVKTNRDHVVYDFNPANLTERIQRFIEDYNIDVDRYKRVVGEAPLDDFVQYNAVKWSESLKKNMQRGRYACFEKAKLRPCLYRPFTRRLLCFDELLVERRYHMAEVFPTEGAERENVAIAVSDIGYRASSFSALASNCIPDIHLCAGVDAHQCFPFYVYDDDGSNRRENITDWALKHFREHYRSKKITKWDIFYYVYGVLHHPGYRARFAENLKRELPRIPLASDFRAFAKAGEKLARLHLDYEKLEPWPLEWIETPDVPLSYHVEKMRLAKDKTAIKVNDSLTLGGIPPKVFEYRLGNRSALEWVVDQYRVSEDMRSGIRSDPNRADDPEYIVRLVRQVVRVSVETVEIVNALPEEFGGEK